jgi:hypothetical protein
VSSRVARRRRVIGVRCGGAATHRSWGPDSTVKRGNSRKPDTPACEKAGKNIFGAMSGSAAAARIHGPHRDAGNPAAFYSCGAIVCPKSDTPGRKKIRFDTSEFSGRTRI